MKKLSDSIQTIFLILLGLTSVFISLADFSNINWFEKLNYAKASLLVLGMMAVSAGVERFVLIKRMQEQIELLWENEKNSAPFRSTRASRLIQPSTITWNCIRPGERLNP